MLALHHCAVSELHQHVEPESVDIILCDPPYPKTFLSCWRELAEFASHALKRGGHLFAMSGHAWLPEILTFFADYPDLRYNWMLAMGPYTPTATCIGRHISRCEWKPVLWYIKPPVSINVRMRDWLQHIVRDKRFHKWGQGGREWIQILDRLKRPRPAIIADPFLGGGTTAVIAVQEGYDFIGADIDAECIEITEQRLATRQEFLFTSSDVHAEQLELTDEILA